MAQRVSVFLSTSPFAADKPFYSKSIACRMAYPTDYTPDLINAALPLLEKIYRSGLEFVKCGVMLMELTPAARHRRDLFDDREHLRRAGLMHAVDGINADYGARTIHFGNLPLARHQPAMVDACGLSQPRYTTRWEELPLVK
jgi:DNA polymerase V